MLPPPFTGTVDIELTGEVVQTMSSIFAITGVGLTVIVCVIGVPEHEFAVGVTVIVAVTGAFVVFVPAKAAILALPVAPKPID